MAVVTPSRRPERRHFRWLRLLWRRFLGQQAGTLAVELAMAVPVMFALMVAGVEVTRYVLLNQKVEPIATRISGPGTRELRTGRFMKIVSLAPEVL